MEVCITRIASDDPIEKPGRQEIANNNPLANDVIQKITVVPNPVNDNATISLFATKAQNADIVLLDISGKVLYKTTRQLTTGDNKINLDMKQQAAGMYFLHIKTGTETHRQKILKQ
jgi:hypothetical protein